MGYNSRSLRAGFLEEAARQAVPVFAAMNYCSYKAPGGVLRRYKVAAPSKADLGSFLDQAVIAKRKTHAR